MLALLRRGPAGAELGLWGAASGRQVLPFAAVPAHKSEEAAAQSSRLREMIGLLTAVAIVLLTYWWRRSSVGIPVALPAGLAVADLGRRGLAALVDMVPAGAIVGVIWYGPLSDYTAAWWASFESQGTTPPSSQGLLWAWVGFAAIYVGWCTVFEMLHAASPGKRLLGCVVMSTSGGRLTRLQIVTRNAARLIELLPYLQLWPFMLLLFMTRNRQRFGDLLARTIVVESLPPAEPDEFDDQ
jgi:uncharacterized RDD family membrane protein YckC